MPDFHKSYKKSKNSKNSKSGGRRRKHTMRKYRRGKKVMRGGAFMWSRYGNIPDSYQDTFMTLAKQTLRKELLFEKTFEITNYTTKDELKELIKNSSDFKDDPEKVKSLFKDYYNSTDWD